MSMVHEFLCFPYNVVKHTLVSIHTVSNIEGYSRGLPLESCVFKNHVNQRAPENKIHNLASTFYVKSLRRCVCFLDNIMYNLKLNGNICRENDESKTNSGVGILN